VTSDIVWVTDGDGNVYSANPAWSRITGVAWPEFGGLKWAQSVHEEDRPLLAPTNSGAPDFHQAEFRLWDAASNDWRWFRSRAVAIASSDGEIEEWITAMRDVHEPKLARERAAIMLGESRHRLKNLVTIIDALAKSSRPATNSNAETDAFLKRFLGRLHALGAAADLALAGDNRIMDLGAAARATLAPFTEGHRHIQISGPDTILSQETGGSVALALHELATNAIKYGALSVPDGSVSLTWETTPVADGEQVVIIWKEHGGPPPKPPEKVGFGTRVIRAAASRERDGKVDLDYPETGLCCRLSFTQATRTNAAN
jgi:two-component system CheB/CheR fusion protein